MLKNPPFYRGDRVYRKATTALVSKKNHTPNQKQCKSSQTKVDVVQTNRLSTTVKQKNHQKNNSEQVTDRPLSHKS
jgi:hypothetical protein